MTDALIGLAVFVAKWSLEVAGRHADNCYLLRRPMSAAIWTTIVCLAGVPMADGNNWAAVAMAVASGVATWIGAKNYERARNAVSRTDGGRIVQDFDAAAGSVPGPQSPEASVCGEACGEAVR